MISEPLDLAAIELAIASSNTVDTDAVDADAGVGAGIGAGAGVDIDAVFSLITQVLPLEICLHYRFVPLSLVRQCLVLGMVDPSDTDALDYAVRMASYQGLTVEPVEIVGQLHHTLLSAYLNHVGQPAESDLSGLAESNVPEPLPVQAVSPQAVSPDAVGFAKSHRIAPPAAGIALLPLNVSIQHLTKPLEAIALLPPPQFLAELFGRILTGGITRVLLGSDGGTGRIAWDRNGTAQLALGQIELPRFRALVAELKAGVGLTSQPVQQPLRRTVMRSYRGQPLMLKLSLEPPGLNAMNAIQGAEEKIQMQVLRGALLIAHERERLARLQYEALETAELLQRKLQQMQTLTQVLPMLQLQEDRLERLTAAVQSCGALLPNLAFSGEVGDRHQGNPDQGDGPEADCPPTA